MRDSEALTLLLCLALIVVILAAATQPSPEPTLYLFDEELQPLTSIDWGTIRAGDHVTRIVYVTASINCTIHAHIDDVSQIGHIRFFNVTKSLQANQKTPLTLTLLTLRRPPTQNFTLDITFRMET